MLLPDQVIRRIEQWLNDRNMSKTVRERLLKETAEEAWEVLFPEDSTPDAGQLSQLCGWNGLKRFSRTCQGIQNDK